MGLAWNGIGCKIDFDFYCSICVSCKQANDFNDFRMCNPLNKAIVIELGCSWYIRSSRRVGCGCCLFLFQFSISLIVYFLHFPQQTPSSPHPIILRKFRRKIPFQFQRGDCITVEGLSLFIYSTFSLSLHSSLLSSFVSVHVPVSYEKKPFSFTVKLFFIIFLTFPFVAPPYIRRTHYRKITATYTEMDKTREQKEYESLYYREFFTWRGKFQAITILLSVGITLISRKLWRVYHFIKVSGLSLTFYKLQTG